jgi:hypothetical protein
MIIHQKPKVLALCIITKGMVQAVYLEKKMGKKLHWVWRLHTRVVLKSSNAVTFCMDLDF